MSESDSRALPANGAQPQSFEKALGRLQAIVDELEEGRVGLEESMRRFEEGIAILRHCFGVLERAERRIEILTGTDGDGQPLTTAWEAESTSADAAEQETSDDESRLF